MWEILTSGPFLFSPFLFVSIATLVMMDVHDLLEDIVWVIWWAPCVLSAIFFVLLPWFRPLSGSASLHEGRILDNYKVRMVRVVLK